MSVLAPEVFLTSPWIPAEWIQAHGLIPRGWFARGTGRAAPLAEGVCAFAQAAVSQAKLNPEAALVFATTCDQLRRAFDAAVEDASRRCFSFNVPATWQTAASRVWFRAELERFGRFLERLGGRAPDAARLAAEMKQRDQQRQALRTAAGRWPAAEYAAAVAHFHWTGEAPSDKAALTKQLPGVPLALIGGPVGRPAMALIENCGGQVALDATESGERSLFPRLPDGDWSADPLGALVSAYLDHGVDVFQRPNSRFYAWLGERLATRRIRGLVLRAFVGCDLWRAEAASLREAFGLPVLVLEADENPGCEAREAGRLQAFVETLQ